MRGEPPRQGTPAARSPIRSLFPFPNVNVSIDRLELKLRPAAVNRTETRFLNHHPEFPAALAAVLHPRLARACVHLDFKVAVDAAVLRLHLDGRLGVRWHDHVDVP